MAAVAIVINKVKKLEDNREIVNATLTFGDGSTTYPSGGVAVAGKNFGCPRFVDSMFFEDDAASTRMYKYDSVNQKIRIYVEGAAIYAEMTGVIPAITLRVQVIGSK